MRIPLQTWLAGYPPTSSISGLTIAQIEPLNHQTASAAIDEELVDLLAKRMLLYS